MPRYGGRTLSSTPRKITPFEAGRVAVNEYKKVHEKNVADLQNKVASLQAEIKILTNENVSLEKENEKLKKKVSKLKSKKKS